MHALTLGLLLIAAPVFACPNLAGKYAQCRSLTGESSGAYDLEVTQKIENRSTVYNWTFTDADTQERQTEVYRADGRNHVRTERDPETGVTISLATQVSCVNNAVKAKMVLKLENEIASSVLVTVTKQGNKLTQVTTGENMGEEINETVVCE